MMWNEGYTTNAVANPPLGVAIMFGIMLRGDSSADVQPNDVFGAPVSEIVLVSGTYAWRIRMPNQFIPPADLPSPARRVSPISETERSLSLMLIAAAVGGTTLNVLTDQFLSPSVAGLLFSYSVSGSNSSALRCVSFRSGQNPDIGISAGEQNRRGDFVRSDAIELRRFPGLRFHFESSEREHMG